MSQYLSMAWGLTIRGVFATARSTLVEQKCCILPTFLALEQTGQMLSRVTSVFFAMTAAHTNDYLQQLDEEFASELAGLGDEIRLSETFRGMTW